jgi:hypothetical protein
VGIKVTFLAISLLVLVTSIMGGSQQSAVSEQNILLSSGPTTLKAVAIPFPVKSLTKELFVSYFAGHDVCIKSAVPRVTLKNAPSSADKLITSLLLDPDHQPYWLRLVESKGQSFILNRSHSGTKLATLNSHKLVHHDNLAELIFPPLFSKNLRESSPPGYFLLI